MKYINTTEIWNQHVLTFLSGLTGVRTVVQLKTACNRYTYPV